LAKTIIDINADLVERCKAGQQDAFHLLYQKYCRQMFSVSMRILQDGAEAEDILQESFVTAFGKIQTFRGDSTFGAWLKRIVVNKSINRVKKKKLALFSLEEKHENTYTEEDPGELAYPDLSVDEIKTAVELLSEGYRLVLSLYLFEGYTHKEIAEELGITESTSKSQYNRAKKRLREIILEKNS